MKEAKMSTTKEARRVAGDVLQFSAFDGRLDNLEKTFDGIEERDILEVLRENDVTTLEELVHRVVQVGKTEKPVAPQPASLVTPARVSSKEIAYQVPEVAVIVDGVEYDPGDITRFNGSPLDFVTDNLNGEPRLLAFTDRQKVDLMLLTYRLSRVRRGPTDGDVGMISSGSAKFHADYNLSGDWFWLDEGYSYLNLTRLYHGPFYDRRDWNDQISSVAWPGGIVLLGWDVNFGLPRLVLQNNGGPGNVPDLRTFGWNDQASSAGHA
ncbi:hypothetical protein ABGB16_23600 [Micromonospora sp. B11E3]|uniref:hypothetical protein n=1 Tax=Micromonospora sp. B11E3 TaxID=3153562 RepID=UPI00325EED2F